MSHVLRVRPPKYYSAEERLVCRSFRLLCLLDRLANGWRLRRPRLAKETRLAYEVAARFVTGFEAELPRPSNIGRRFMANIQARTPRPHLWLVAKWLNRCRQAAAGVLKMHAEGRVCECALCTEAGNFRFFLRHVGRHLSAAQAARARKGTVSP